MLPLSVDPSFEFHQLGDCYFLVSGLVHLWRAIEVVLWRGGRSRPLKGTPPPWIIPCNLSVAHATSEVPEENYLCQEDNKGTYRRN